MPPVILMRTPFAPFIDESSSSGLAIAASAASRARRSPSASPVPIIALPISLITERISAKSRLIRPGITIRSVTPRTPEYSTSSAIAKASAKVVFSLAMRNRFWLGMTISVSTNCSNSSIPASAWVIRWLPSNWKGLVTTPTVRMPCSFAARAITGAPPVPVPPPMPAAMNIMLAPSSSAMISSIASSAAAQPTSGRDPAPRPWVMLAPSWIRRSAFDCTSACASVLATTKSTPSNSELIMLLTALPPAPPTPMTVSFGFNCCVPLCSGTLRWILMVTSLILADLKVRMRRHQPGAGRG